MNQINRSHSLYSSPRLTQRINVDPSSGPGGSDNDPAIRGSTTLATMLEQIIPEVLWQVIVFQQTLSLWMLRAKTSTESNHASAECKNNTYIAITAVKDVQRAVIISGPEVVHVVLHLKLDAITLVVFTALELLVSVLFGQPLKYMRRNKNCENIRTSAFIDAAHLEGPLLPGRPVILCASQHGRQVGLLKPTTKFLD